MIGLLEPSTIIIYHFSTILCMKCSMTVSKAVRYSLYLKPFHSVLKTVDFDKKWIGSIPDRRLFRCKYDLFHPFGFNQWCGILLLPWQVFIDYSSTQFVIMLLIEREQSFYWTVIAWNFSWPCGWFIEILTQYDVTQS